MLRAYRIHIPILSILDAKHITSKYPVTNIQRVSCTLSMLGVRMGPFCIIPSAFEEIEEALADLEGEPSYSEVGSSVGSQNLLGSVDISWNVK